MSGERPYTLIAELTYRCPLRCPYCSNPLDYQTRRDELATADWLRVLEEAEELGVLQVNLTGGEPLLRADLEAIVTRARELQLYTTLITSGLPLARERLSELRECGLDAVQVSVQDAEATRSNQLAGTDSFEQKLAVARWVKELGLPLTLNCVLHRQNLAHVERIVELAQQLAADRLELANTQYLGWALENREALLPTRSALADARALAASAKARLQGRMEVLFVLPDYYSDRPKSCMGGWGQRYLLVNPEGTALPCHLAHTIPGLTFANVREQGLREIWQSSPGFAAFRGEGWMKEPCRDCEQRGRDFGGCRCQAFHLTGDAASADPACALAPAHSLIQAARRRAECARETGLEPIQLRYRGSKVAR